MTNITKAAQQALEALESLVHNTPYDGRYSDAIIHLRAALQDKAGEVQGYEPAGFLLHWPAPGGGRDTLWSRDGAAGHAIGCPVTEIFKATDRAAHPAPVVPDDHPLVVFAKECELGTYMEHETPMAARKAISAAKAIGITAKADTVAPDVARYRAIRNGLVYIEPHESGEIYVAGETGVYTKSGDEFDAAIDAIATSQQKGWSSG